MTYRRRYRTRLHHDGDSGSLLLDVETPRAIGYLAAHLESFSGSACTAVGGRKTGSNNLLSVFMRAPDGTDRRSDDDSGVAEEAVI